MYTRYSMCCSHMGYRHTRFTCSTVYLCYRASILRRLISNTVRPNSPRPTSVVYPHSLSDKPSSHTLSEL